MFRSSNMSTFDLKYVKPENTSFVKKVLPETNFTGVISKLHRKSVEQDEYQLEILCKANIPLEQIKQFVQNFGAKNECVYVCRNTNKRDCLYRLTFKCQHSLKKLDQQNSNSRKKNTKGTECKSFIHVGSKVTKENNALTKINIMFIHNHELTSAEALRCRRPQLSVVETFEKLFREGKMSPADALKTYKQSLLTNTEASDIKKIMLDRKIMPDYDWVRHFYHSLRKRNLSPGSSIESATPDSTSSPPRLEENADSLPIEIRNPAAEISTIQDNLDLQLPFVMKLEVFDDENSSSVMDINEEIEQLSKNFAQLIQLLKSDPLYYSDGVVAINRNLRALLDNPNPADLFNALITFNT